MSASYLVTKGEALVDVIDTLEVVRLRAQRLEEQTRRTQRAREQQVSNDDTEQKKKA